MDTLIIGCGLTGAVIARELAEQGRRPHPRSLALLES